MLAVNDLLQKRYLIVRKLGEGGMGSVYEALDQRLGNTIALKETKFHEDWLLRAFEHEARLLAKLRHPALPKVIDHFTEGDGQFLVMEFIPGHDLGSQVEKTGRGFDPNNVLNWGDELLDALHYLHTQKPPIIHRDVKPQNLKLTEEGKVVLLDFGLAKTMLSGTLVYGFSNHYSPLEQKQGATTDARTDLYSFGATLYYLMTAHKPVDAQLRAAAIASQQGDPLTPIAEVNPSVSRTVSSVLMNAMALDPDDRPPSAIELRRMLNDARASSSSTVAASAQAGTPRRIEILLAQGAQAGSIKSNLSSAGIAQPNRERQLDILADPARSQNIAARHHPTSSQEVTLMSKVRNWAARNFVVALAQLIVAILAIALTIFLYLNSRRTEGKPSNNTPVANASTGISETPKPTRAEVMSYYVELKDGRKTAMAHGESVSSKERFKFHFMPRSRGYLYIIAPGDGNIPMTFLTNSPMPDSGVSTNALEANSDFQFPGGNWIGLRDDSYQTSFAIIFSPTRLTSPGFLASPAGRTLALAEQREFDSFLDKHKASASDLITEEQTNGTAITVSTLAERVGREPLVFKIEIMRR